MAIEKGSVLLNEKAWDNLTLTVDNLAPSSIFVIIDENIENYCLPHFVAKFGARTSYQTIPIPLGERHKNIQTCIYLWETLSRKGADRNSLIVNLGGGVITDIGGFVASTYMRGISFINIPTTLLAMVDASVGGKTGIDFNHVKNQIGTIKLPEIVVIDADFLNTLPENQLLSGFAEMIKHSLIDGETSWNALNTINYSDMYSNPDLIMKSIRVKQEVVSEDPFEKGRRKVLNFGHTLGHAIESHFMDDSERFPLLHGEAIAIGMILAAYLSTETIGLTSEKLSAISSYIMSLYPKQNFSKEDIENIIQLMSFDKKNHNGKVLFVLMEDFGAFKLDCEVDNALIFKAFEFYRNF